MEERVVYVAVITRISREEQENRGADVDLVERVKYAAEAAVRDWLSKESLGALEVSVAKLMETEVIFREDDVETYDALIREIDRIHPNMAFILSSDLADSRVRFMSRCNLNGVSSSHCILLGNGEHSLTITEVVMTEEMHEELQEQLNNLVWRRKREVE